MFVFRINAATGIAIPNETSYFDVIAEVIPTIKLRMSPEINSFNHF